jgi:hypothetical protein
MTESQKNWKWFGHALHFIGSNDCRFRMGTQIGRYVISTVGEYLPGGNQQEEFSDIGYQRKYETMVFKVGKILPCGCPKINPSEIDMMPYNNPKDAMRGHMAMCEKWSKARARPAAEEGSK